MNFGVIFKESLVDTRRGVIYPLATKLTVLEIAFVGITIGVCCDTLAEQLSANPIALKSVTTIQKLVRISGKNEFKMNL